MMVLKILWLLKKFRVRFFFRFKLADLNLSRLGKEGTVTKVGKDDNGRDVWLCHDDIVLNDIGFEFGETDKNIVMDQSGYQEYMDTENAANLTIKR